MHFVFMGVSGSGKTTVAERVARELGLPFAEADAFHPRANIDKMAAGTPLTDEDRWPWLRELAGWIAAHDALGESTVMACSALKRSYRDLLREGAPGVHFLHMSGPEEVIWERIAARTDHFMPPALLRSQLETLESLEPDEAGREFDVRSDPDVLVREALAYVETVLQPS
ncbi:gluconokinase [Nocardiopsis changdeensis]|uniref:Gluconokinase n=1 Tax=Nocardiopsis changdeensis TaxID=2831969 RepID=A0ABX8BRP7_9ACTN|nr:MULTISPECIES: gluconokinase [Nocardiopsis]QUX23939.1 gluconokinase [Nocardiopsis changdeensis]QYX39885.1 gluconokinase [Nocardiopsis sp. MT53]